MSITHKILPSLALAIALAPLAAQARNADFSPQAVQVSPIVPGSATIDHPTMICTGVGVSRFPDSFGG
jgi:hypothetical protein